MSMFASSADLRLRKRSSKLCVASRQALPGVVSNYREYCGLDHWSLVRLSRRESADGSDFTVLLLAAGKELFRGEVGQIEELIGEGFADQRTECFGFSMRAAQRLRHDVIDYTELKEILGCHFERRRGVGNLCGIIPENGCAAFR